MFYRCRPSNLSKNCMCHQAKLLQMKLSETVNFLQIIFCSFVRVFSAEDPQDSFFSRARSVRQRDYVSSRFSKLKAIQYFTVGWTFLLFVVGNLKRLVAITPLPSPSKSANSERRPRQNKAALAWAVYSVSSDRESSVANPFWETVVSPLELLRLKLVSVTVLGDGNCLYRAIAYALFVDVEWYQDVRQAVVATGRNNMAFFYVPNGDFEPTTIEEGLREIETSKLGFRLSSSCRSSSVSACYLCAGNRRRWIYRRSSYLCHS